MKKITLSTLVVLTTFIGYSQQKVQIKLCTEMAEFKDGLQFSVVTENDTLLVPQLGETKFVNPLNLAGNAGSMDKSDTSRVTLIIENYKYRYSFPIGKQDLFCGYLGICTEQAKYNKKLTQWSYINCQSLKSIGFAEKEKKSRKG